MTKYTVKAPPSGLFNGQPWPEAGKTVELAEEVGEGMVTSGILEKKGAAKPAKKAAKKPDTAEKATASKADVETRKKS